VTAFLVIIGLVPAVHAVRATIWSVRGRAARG